MGLMSIAEIIKEIDAYVVRLRNARDLLLPPMTEARRKGDLRRNRAVVANKRGRSPSSTVRIIEDESRFDRTTTPMATPKQQVDSPSRVRSFVAPQAATTREPPVAVPAQATQQDARAERIPAPNRKISSTRTERRPVTKRAFGTALEYSKPAISLAGRVHSKIVVVSAEQAQQEREREAQPTVQRPRVPRIGLTGRAAFEALFNDGTNTKTTKD
jgi:hypothetical protein